MKKAMVLLKKMYDLLRIYTDNGKTDHEARLILREYEQSEYYPDNYDIKKGKTNG